jgi:hypothetical protein
MIEVLGFDSRRGLGNFLFTTISRIALGPTQPPIQRVPRALSLRVKRPGRQADHSLPSSAKVKNSWSYIFTLQYVFMAWCLVKHRVGVGKVKLSVCFLFNWASRSECVLGMEVSSTGKVTPPPDAQWIGEWVRATAGLDAGVKRIFPASAGIRTSDHSARSPALYNWDIPDPLCHYMASKKTWG